MSLELTNLPSHGVSERFYVTPPRSLEESVQRLQDDTVIEFLRDDAKQQGIPWYLYCRQYGIQGDALDRRIRKYEVQYDLFDAIERENND